MGYILICRRIVLSIIILVTANFVLHAVEVKLNWRVLDWDYNPIDGAVGVLEIAGMESVSAHGGWLIFSGELQAGTLSSNGLTRHEKKQVVSYYLLNGRRLSQNAAEPARTDVMQLLIHRQGGGGKRLIGFSKTQGYVEGELLKNEQYSLSAQVTGANENSSVVDTLYVTKEGYHTNRSLVSAYNMGDISYLVPLPPPDSIPPGMVHIPEGEFVMGSMHGDPDETPIRTVHLSSFYMDTVEVTQGEYETVMGATPWNSIAGTGREDIGPEYPAWGISWYDAVLFCNKKSKAEGRDTVYEWTSIEGTPGDGATISNVEIHLERRGYRLPTEAEWEYACRGGGNTEYMWGTDKNAGDAYAWYQDNSGYHTHKVAQKDPNWFNIYDIVGNVYEWANDWYGRNYNSETTNPLETRPGSSRIIRGGCYLSPPVNLSVSDRAGGDPAVQHETQGFRTVLSDW